MSDRPLHVPAPPPSVSELVTEDGEPMETTRHRDQMVLLIHSLQSSYRARDDFYVSGNMFVYFSLTQTKKNDFRGPDVFVTLNTDQRERRAWVVWEENGKMPDIVIELTSDSTRQEDHGRKKDVYARILKVSEYFIFDPWSGQLQGFNLDASQGVYLDKQPDKRGYLRCAQLGLWLGKRHGTLWGTTCDWLRWLDDEGRVLPVGDEAAEHERQRAEQERLRAEQERQRAESASQQADGERQRAEQERLRAEQASQRATSASQRANALAEKLRALGVDPESVG